MHLTLKKNKMMQLYKQIEFIYNNTNQNNYYVCWYNNSTVETSWKQKNEIDKTAAQEEKESYYHIFDLLLFLRLLWLFF